MRKTIRALKSTDLVHAPAFPHTGPWLFQRVRAAMTDMLGFQPGFERLGLILGESTTVGHYWFTSLPHDHVIGFLSLLERLPEPKRSDLLKEFCRELPTIDHTRLAHDPLAVSKLESLLRLKRGLTWIQSGTGTEFQRTFLISALGHSHSIVNGRLARVCGLDVHEPKKWVPVETVVYFREILPAAKLRALISQVWPQITSSNAPLLLLNGVWSAMPELRQEIIKLARNHHVVVADSAVAPKQIEGLVQVVTVGADPENELRIHVKVEAV